MRWTPEKAARMGQQIGAANAAFLAKGFQYPLVCLIVARNGYVTVLRYMENEPLPVCLLDYKPGVDCDWPIGMFTIDATLRFGYSLIQDTEPLENLKQKLFPVGSGS